MQTRSHESILAEARQMVQEKEFKGYIHDVGGPTADFRGPACKKQLTKGACPNRNCLFPEPCKNMVADHRDYVLSLIHIYNVKYKVEEFTGMEIEKINILVEGVRVID